MRCKFLEQGLAIDYSGTVKPCCAFQTDDHYRSENHITKIDFRSWHESSYMEHKRAQLDDDQWPTECGWCQETEGQNRQDSIRLGGDRAYSLYGSTDLVLEIRPGNTCNFACQTCWPAASSRVADYHKRAGIIAIEPPAPRWDYRAIKTVLCRIKDIVVLGGEPFYDKRCLQFLHWLSRQDHQPRITMFTNGSCVDIEFLANYGSTITLVFSLDAVGRPAEYIRYGTEWPTVWQNFISCSALPNVDVRVNITTSPYNYVYIDQLISQLLPVWPKVVTWGVAGQGKSSGFMNESVIPIKHRRLVIDQLQSAKTQLATSAIEPDQRANAYNAVDSLMTNLVSQPFNPDDHDRMRSFILKMDTVKHCEIRNYCPEVAVYFGL